MIKLSQTGVGTTSHPQSIRDSAGSALLPVQAQVQGTATFRLLGRVSPDAPWIEILAPGTASLLESMAWVPFIQLEITTGTGTVTVWIGDN